MTASWTCWNTIGVSGDRSCPELVEHVHCRHCPVYSSAARAVLDDKVSATHRAEWTRHFAEPKAVADTDSQSMVVFRIAAEWFALSTPTVWEVTDLRPIHSLPHRPTGAVLGLVNVRGELLVCVSLGRLLEPDGHEPPAPTPVPVGRRRLLVIRHDGIRVVCLADEVDGVHRVHPRDLKAVPSTVARSEAPHSRAVMTSRGRSIGVLDDQLLFQAIARSVA